MNSLRSLSSTRGTRRPPDASRCSTNSCISGSASRASAEAIPWILWRSSATTWRPTSSYRTKSWLLSEFLATKVWRVGPKPSGHLPNLAMSAPRWLPTRLYRRAVIDREVWLGLRGLFRSRWLESRERQRRQREGRDGGPPYGVLVRQSLGPALVELASRLMASGALTTTKAGRVLGVSPRNAHTIFAAG